MAQKIINNLDPLLAVREYLNDNFTELYKNTITETPTEVGIISGVATITLTSHFLSAESGITDTLDTITDVAVTDGQLFFLKPDEGDTLTISNNGNIITPSGVNYVIPVNGMVLLQYDANLTTPKWRMIGNNTLKNITTVNAATYTLLEDDYILNITYTATGAVDISIPSAQCVEGKVIVIKDSGALAGTNNITITPVAENIDGSATLVLNGNYESATLYSDGSNWFII